MNVVDENVGGTLVVQPSGRLDSNTSPAFEKHLVGHLDQGAMAVVIDFAQLEYISSAGLRVLLMGAKRAKQANGRIALCNLSDSIREVLEISGFLSILNVFSDRDAALSGIDS
jgi:anti-anti-sigma factor